MDFISIVLVNILYQNTERLCSILYVKFSVVEYTMEALDNGYPWDSKKVNTAEDDRRRIVLVR